MNNMESTATESKQTVTPHGDVSHTGFSIASIRIQEGTVDELEMILRQKIDTSSAGYLHAPVVLNVEEVGNLNTFDYISLQEVCRQHNLFLIGVTGVVNEDRADALVRRRIPVVNSTRYSRIRQENIKPKIITQLLEVKVPVEVPVPYEIKVPYEVKVPAPIRIYRRNVRSGETINGQNSSIAIYGSVGSHARIIASHHVFIFGSVKGADIFAGTPKSTDDPGLTDAIIHVQGEFTPGIIAIAGNYSTAEDLDKEPELIEVQQKNNGIIITLKDGQLKYSAINDYRQG